MTRLAATCAALLVLACAAPIHTELHAGAEPPPVAKLAVLPVQIDPMTLGDVPSEAPDAVTARILAALDAETRLRVVDAPQADAVLSGFVRRWAEREGSATGVRHPASVWIVLELRDGDSRLLWTGTYEETQAPLSEDLGSLPRAWDRGFRWVTAQELADYGARELVRALAAEIATWS